MRSLSILILVLFAVWVPAQPHNSKEGAEILQRIHKLRSLDDTVRAAVTRQLALDIRKLPAGTEKTTLAYDLANVSTEGDFGRATLQEVTTTLDTAAKADKLPIGSPEYEELAELYRYEHMKVDAAQPGVKAALRALDEANAIREHANFTLTDLNGKTWTRSALKGKIVLVNFWATWCPPCRKEMPDLDALYKEFQPKGLVILAISDETEEKVRPFIAQKGYSYPVMLDPGKKVHELYRVQGIPKSFIYNRKGEMVAQTIDMRTRGQFLELLRQAGLR